MRFVIFPCACAAIAGISVGGGGARLPRVRHACGRWILQTDTDGTSPVDRVLAMLQRMVAGTDLDC